MAWSENPIEHRGLATVDGTLVGGEPAYGRRRRGGAGDPSKPANDGNSARQWNHLTSAGRGAAVKCLQEGLRPEQRSSTRTARTRLLAHHAIPVPVSHVPVRQVRTRDRSDAVPTRLLAGDLPVSIVVVARECIITGGGGGSGFTR